MIPVTRQLPWFLKLTLDLRVASNETPQTAVTCQGYLNSLGDGTCLSDTAPNLGYQPL